MAEQKYSFYNFFIKLNKFKKNFKFVCFYKLHFTLKKYFMKNNFYYLFNDKFNKINSVKINFNVFNIKKFYKNYKHNSYNLYIYNIISN